MLSGGSERILRPSASMGSGSSSGRNAAAWGRSISGRCCRGSTRRLPVGLTLAFQNDSCEAHAHLQHPKGHLDDWLAAYRLTVRL